MLTVLTWERFELLLQPFASLLPYCLMYAPQPSDAIPPYHLPLYTHLSVNSAVNYEWISYYPVRSGFVSICLSAWDCGLLVILWSLSGKNRKRNKILLGSRPAEQAEKDMFACCPLWPVSPPSGRLHCGLFLEDSLSPESCTSGLLLSSAFWKVFRLSTVFDPFLSSLVVLVQAVCYFIPWCWVPILMASLAIISRRKSTLCQGGSHSFYKYQVSLHLALGSSCVWVLFSGWSCLLVDSWQCWVSLCHMTVTS